MTTTKPISQPYTPQRTRERHTCGGCQARWTGLRTSHCGTQGCHRTFSSVAAFDRHRAGGVCNDPADLGMVLRTDRSYDRWITCERTYTHGDDDR